jgi:hypothetical protein
MAVRGKRSLLPSLAGVKGPSGCAIRQSLKSSIVILKYIDGPVILELETNFFVDARAIASERVESSSSDNDVDGDLEFSSVNRDSSEAKQGCSSISTADGDFQVLLSSNPTNGKVQVKNDGWGQRISLSASTIRVLYSNFNIFFILSHLRCS